jgi:RNA polymerase sigma-70 factor (ECF subfamily)
MMDLEQLERAVLEGARKELAPSASDRMRIRSHLLGNPAWFQPAPVRRSIFRGLTRSWRGGLALGFAVGALLGFGVSHGVSLALQRDAAPAAREELAAAPAVEPSKAPAAPAHAMSEQDTTAPEESASEAEPDELDKLADPPRHAQSAAARKAATRGAQERRARNEAEESGSTLAQELALLQRARRALNRNDALLALGIVQSLDERFPDGVLMEERVATRILSLCQLGRNAEATEQGHHFLLAHPRSVYAERVRHSCVGGR